MSVKLRDIKRRIGSTTHIGKVTSALQQVASAKLAHNRRRVDCSTRYTERIMALLQVVASSAPDSGGDLMRSSSSATGICVIVIGSDRGLCGGYNSAVMDQILKLADSHGKENLSLITIGRIPSKRAIKAGFNVISSYEIPSLEEHIDFLDSISKRVMSDFLRHEFASVRILHTQFLGLLNKPATIIDLLPLTDAALMLHDNEENQQHRNVFSAALFDPSPEYLVEALLPEVIRQILDYTYLHSVCSEDAFRQEAMMRAADNAKAMLHDLKLTYSRLRQENITTEMLEIVAAGYGGTRN
jgi:F-type H+-transporting ATPase subunit gamma